MGVHRRRFHPNIARVRSCRHNCAGACAGEDRRSFPWGAEKCFSLPASVTITVGDTVKWTNPAVVLLIV